jgi:hypothetical protein|tara:strand:+ start:2927 stop:3127 length:201 start_codon:yes stop_codon:yes gene_type:complete
MRANNLGAIGPRVISVRPTPKDPQPILLGPEPKKSLSEATCRIMNISSAAITIAVVVFNVFYLVFI